ncbi:cytidine deaminase-like protein [Morchella conica CCBAS932]|uniref:Cytidine deaminase-like protein n=1 Tax=Morchella conica CCBAS932 TaxID=1392247 RepID=A0A3N4KWE7_9PEZI|nr:cytidine deaminase-like protein [Morchella conica CCBAS932]
MRHALTLATHALSTLEVPVACLFVHTPTSTILSTGHNDTNRSLLGTRHAEFLAIESILLTHPPDIFADTTLYVTVEPCVMCASALDQLRVRRVVYGCANERFGGCGGAVQVRRGFECVGGVYREEAILLLRRFYVQENGRAPRPAAKGGRELKLVVEPLGG